MGCQDRGTQGKRQVSHLARIFDQRPPLLGVKINFHALKIAKIAIFAAKRSDLRAPFSGPKTGQTLKSPLFWREKALFGGVPFRPGPFFAIFGLFLPKIAKNQALAYIAALYRAKASASFATQTERERAAGKTPAVGDIPLQGS